MNLRATALRQLAFLLKAGRQTLYGKRHHLCMVHTYEDFTNYVPLIEYSDIAHDIDLIKQGVENVLWPGFTDKFAVSSGTTGSGKHIPIPHDRIKADVRFMRSVMFNLLRKPDFRILGGTHLSIVGSLEKAPSYEIGEISAILTSASPKWIRLLQYPDPATILYQPWSKRFETLITSSIERDIRVISGVPSWIFVLFKEVIKRTNKSIDQLWPNLSLILTGGVALTSYIKLFTGLLGTLKPAFYENYGASEGYFAHGWFNEGWMPLKYDHGIFYEFILLDDANQPSSSKAIPLWEVQPKMTYQLVVSHFGLWRYKTNDLVQFKSGSLSTKNPSLRIIGRANEMTDHYGEALGADEAKQALQTALNANIQVPHPQHHHIKSTWSETEDLPYHDWILIYERSISVNAIMEQYQYSLIHRIDEWICRHNRHYAIRRETGVLGTPKMTIMDMDAYIRLLSSLPKAQSKLPFFI